MSDDLLNPTLRLVRARKATREAWRNAPAWVRRQECYGAWLNSSSAVNAIRLQIVAKYRANNDLKNGRWYLESTKEGASA
jgi:hypothetical protein